MIDIDNFKKINDIYGHNAGDYALKKLADIMRDSCHDQIVSRWGGEVGYAMKNDTASLDEWIRKADEKLYYGKNNGKNVVIG